MSVRMNTTSGNHSIDAPYLSSNHKVMHYLQNSTHCTTKNPLSVAQKASFQIHDLFHIKDTSMPNRPDQSSQIRLRASSDNGSSSSMTETSSRSDFSLGSSLSDPGAYGSTFSSNTSSSGIGSLTSDVGQEEGTSTSSEELDFNLGFDQISSNDDHEIADLNDIDDGDDDDDDEDQCDHYDGDQRRISMPNSVETATLRDMNESNLDARINELEEYLRKSYSPTSIKNGHVDDDDDEGDDCPFDNDDTITNEHSKLQHRASLLNDSTRTLCAQDRFSTYTDEAADRHDEQMINGIAIRSNSLGIVPLNSKTVLLDKAPKKVVRFADMLGLDLESIRYMTPPDQSTTSMIQECIRIKLEQLRLAKSQANSMSSAASPPLTSPFHLVNGPNRSSSSASLSKFSPQYYLVSKFFTSPTNIIPLIYQRQVMLECLYTKDSIAYGTVRVHNTAYDKRVFARVTDDEWQTCHDIQAWHSMTYPDDHTDTFTFEIRLGKYLDPSKAPKDLYFAVCLQAMGQEFWDNNAGWNYILNVLERR